MPLVVAGEAAAEPPVYGEGEPSEAARIELSQRLLDYYATFMEKETRFLRNMWRGKLSEQACEDVAQEAFMRAARKASAGQLDPTVKIGAYLRTTSFNLAIDRHRADERFDFLDATAVVEATPSQRSEDVDPLHELVRPAIEAMPPSRRRTIVQLQSQGLDDAQISAELGIAPARVHRDRYTAISELRSRLDAFIRDRHRKKTQRAKKDR